ncbi:hypothetical protein D9619_001688 [Psilocybe cf. subviscida]|uniref:DUF6533 domain-containing protein n=1 Tax=Psilocybe cf. subviscida TaxID=2480587 RepID=A0A8H5BD71_9AGAR|nr:hypothetical protein D9619_001688 [Psilocybe cf. subviscida]
MSMDPTTANAINQVIQNLLSAGMIGPKVTYVDVAACTLFVWDYIITFDLEVQYIWKSRWTTVKMVYLIQRYLPFFDSCYLELYRQLAHHLSVGECRVLPFIAGALWNVGIIFSEILLGMRVWAVWNRNKYIGIGLVISGVILFSASGVGMYYYANSLKYLDFSLLGLDLPGCMVISAGEASIISWSALMVWNAITLVVIVIPGWTAYRSGTVSELTILIYRDGAYYYLYLFLFSALNIVFTTTLQPSLRIMVTLLERTLHSMLASRVLLHMREQVATPHEFWSDSGLQMNSSSGAYVKSNHKDDLGNPTSPHDYKPEFGTPQSLHGKSFA